GRLVVQGSWQDRGGVGPVCIVSVGQLTANSLNLFREAAGEDDRDVARVASLPQGYSDFTAVGGKAVKVNHDERWRTFTETGDFGGGSEPGGVNRETGCFDCGRVLTPVVGLPRDQTYLRHRFHRQRNTYVQPVPSPCFR